MKNSFEYCVGNKPILISMPHNASLIPDDVTTLMTMDACKSADTDWYLDKLYDFAAALGVHTIIPEWSRYYIDLNRDPSGKDLYPGEDNTELCPTTDFSNQPLYVSGAEPGQLDIEQRVNKAWKPYHQCLQDVLNAMVAEHGHAILFEAHSIRSVVPRFFDGQLPDFNFGTAGGKSCDGALLLKIEELDFTPWSQVSNGRFKGGYITRHYGDPENNIHAIQLELSQATYLSQNETTWEPLMAEKIKRQLQTIIATLLQWSDETRQ